MTSGVQDGVDKNPTFARYIARAGREYARLSATPRDYNAFVAQISKMWETEPNWTDAQLKTIKAPVLVVDGDHDEAIKRDHTEYIAATIPGAGLLILPNTSHFAFLQDPARSMRRCWSSLAIARPLEAARTPSWVDGFAALNPSYGTTEPLRRHVTSWCARRLMWSRARPRGTLAPRSRGFCRSGHKPRSVRSRPSVCRITAKEGHSAATEPMAFVARSALAAALSKSRQICIARQTVERVGLRR